MCLQTGPSLDFQMLPSAISRGGCPHVQIAGCTHMKDLLVGCFQCATVSCKREQNRMGQLDLSCFYAW